MRGLIPTAWYPNWPGAQPGRGIDRRVARCSAWARAGGTLPASATSTRIAGSVAVLPVPDAAQLASFTAAVRGTIAWQAVDEIGRATGARHAHPGSSARGRSFAHRARGFHHQGEPHLRPGVRRHRQGQRRSVAGDVRRATSLPISTSWRDEFVLLDNFYATGGNSADGHQWLTQANETDYCMWPGYAGRSYPFDGTDPIAYSKNGFLWDYALGRGKTVRVYGEYRRHSRRCRRRPAEAARRTGRTGDDFSARLEDRRRRFAPLNKILAPNFPAVFDQHSGRDPRADFPGRT